MRSPLHKWFCSSVTLLINESSIIAAYSNLNLSPSSAVTSTFHTSFPHGGENQSAWLTRYLGKCGDLQGQTRSRELSLMSKAAILKLPCLSSLPFIKKSLLGTYWYDDACTQVTLICLLVLCNVAQKMSDPSCQSINQVGLSPEMPRCVSLPVILSTKEGKQCPAITLSHTKASCLLQAAPWAAATKCCLPLI